MNAGIHSCASPERVNKMSSAVILQIEVSIHTNLQDRSNYIPEGKKNGPVVLPDMILHCFVAASNIVSNVIGVF